jgi:hypothetical protein
MPQTTRSLPSLLISISALPFGGINLAADPDYGIAHRK